MNLILNYGEIVTNVEIKQQFVCLLKHWIFLTLNTRLLKNLTSTLKSQKD